MYKTPAYVGIILKKDNHVLLVKRTNTDWASGYWNFPGGLLEENETLIAAAAREAHEEVAVRIPLDHLKLVHVLQARKTPTHNKQIIGFYFMADSWEGTPINKEPHRHSAIGWFDIDNLPERMTVHAQQALDGLKNNKTVSINE